MEENFKRLWAASSIAWPLHVGYVSLFSARTKKLGCEIATLES